MTMFSSHVVNVFLFFLIRYLRLSLNCSMGIHSELLGRYTKQIAESTNTPQ